MPPYSDPAILLWLHERHPSLYKEGFCRPFVAAITLVNSVESQLRLVTIPNSNGR
jgi:hypothetical protein